MALLAKVAALALISTPAFCADLVITKSKHKDGLSAPGMEVPAEDSTEVSWLGKDRMRCEEGDAVTIVRSDLKKMYFLDMKAKTVSTVDMPLDLKKYVPARMVPKIDPMVARAKVLVTPTTETKKIKDWNATKYTAAVTSPVGIEFTHEIWATKDVKFDRAAFDELSAAMMSTVIGGAAMAAEYRKIDGLPVVIERTQTTKSGAAAFKTREEVTAVESKEAPENWYEIPKGFTEIPYDPMADRPTGRGARPEKAGGPPPADKPKEKQSFGVE